MSLSRMLLAPVLAALAAGFASAQTTPFSDCGTLVPGVTCPLLFQSDTAGLFLLDDPLVGYSAGDRVFVSGDADPGCITICQQGNGCIFNSVVSPSCGLITTRYCSPAVPNSTGLPGMIDAAGQSSVPANDVTLSASQLPPGQFGYFLASRTQGMVTPPGSAGPICLAGAIARFNQPARIIQGPTGSAMVDLTAFPLTPPVAVMPGETWNFQCWYRDAGNTSNFTDALGVSFTP